MIERLKEDNLFIGLIYGLVSIALFYGIAIGANEIYFRYYQYYLLQPPKLQIVVLALNLILFRFVMLRWKKFEMGKGMLLTLFMTVVIYVIAHRNII